jgi:iron(III) transport system permease protein
MQLIAWSSENIKNNIPLELILNSFLIGFIVALAASVIAIILSLGSFKSSNRLIFDLSTIGYAIPGSVLAVSLLLVFSFYFGLSITVFGIWGLFLCLLIRFITPLIRYLDAALSSMTEETLSATMIYSRSLLKTFRSIYFPALYPSVLFGFLVVFIEVIKEQPATLLLRPVGFDTLSSKIYNFTSEGQWELAATPSIAIILISLILVLILNNRVDNE